MTYKNIFIHIFMVLGGCLALFLTGLVIFDSIKLLITPDSTFQKTEIGDSSKNILFGLK